MSLCAEHTEYLWAGALPELLDRIKKQWGMDLEMPADATVEASFWLPDGSITIQPSYRHLEKQYWIATFTSQERLTGDEQDIEYAREVRASNAQRYEATEKEILNAIGQNKP